MTQTEMAKVLGVSKAYVSMVLSGKKEPSRRVAEELGELGVNLPTVNFVSGQGILSHARLPIPALPHD